MDRDTFQAWLDRYVAAWRGNDREAILALFSDDVAYRYTPWEEPVRGRDALADDWLKEPDVPDSWEAEYHPIAIDGDLAVAQGVSRYLTEDRSSVDRLYHNVFICRFDAEGRCSEFTEFYMKEKDD